jgi:heme/copper-type cytochrome/quinol oxidase subunit 2
MQIIVQAMDQPQYDQWVKQQLAAAHPSPSA